jgi:hypothetical protein
MPCYAGRQEEANKDRSLTTDYSMEERKPAGSTQLSTTVAWCTREAATCLRLC